MGQFVYFTPHQVASHAGLGIDYAFDGEGAAHAQMPGPEGAEGTFFSRHAAMIRYLPDAQTWSDPLEGGLMVGMNNDAVPTPADLARGEQLVGERLVLADGNLWLVPRLRVYLAGDGWAVALPQRMQRRGGEWTAGEVLERYREADALAEELLDRMVRAQAEDAAGRPDVARGLSILKAAELATRVLAVNYRVGPEELSLLGTLANDQTLASVLRTAIDYDTAEADALGKLEALAA